MLNGIKLAVDEINAVGGYLGRPLELVIKDDRADPEQGRWVSQTAGRRSLPPLALQQRRGAQGHRPVPGRQSPLIVPCATATAITAKYPAPDSYIFRVQGRDAIQGAVHRGRHRQTRLGQGRHFADKTGYGEGGYNDMVAALATKNLKPVYVGRFDLGVKDLTAELTAARATRGPT